MTVDFSRSKAALAAYDLARSHRQVILSAVHSGDDYANLLEKAEANKVREAFWQDTGDRDPDVTVAAIRKMVESLE